MAKLYSNLVTVNFVYFLFIFYQLYLIKRCVTSELYILTVGLLDRATKRDMFLSRFHTRHITRFGSVANHLYAFPSHLVKIFRPPSRSFVPTYTPYNRLVENASAIKAHCARCIFIVGLGVL